MLFQRVPAGSFHMGQRGRDSSEEPVHTVRITRDFYLGKFPVTQEQFAAWTSSDDYAAWLGIAAKAVNQLPHANFFVGRPRHPAEYMSWFAAVAFCGWVGRRAEGLPAGHVPWLPTEAEWEYACRWSPDPIHPDHACTPSSCARTDYYSGDGIEALAEVGWFGESSHGSTHSVDEKPESPPA